MPSSYTPPANRDIPLTDRNITNALSFNPDVVIISYVSNKLNPNADPTFALTLAETMTTLQTMKDSANKAGKVCFITTTQPRTEFNAADRLHLRVLKDSILNRFGFFAINFFDPIADPADNTIRAEFRVPGDNVHTNNAGHRMLFQQVLAKDILNAALPVTITNFSGKIQSNQVLLQWTSHDEEPYTTYTVERSGNGVSYTAIKSIDAKEGVGEKRYSVVDAGPLSGTNYYRLHIDQPSGKEYSKVIAVKNAVPGMVIKRISPHSSQHITLQITSPRVQSATVEIFGSNGTRIKSITRQLQRDINIINIPIETLSAGNYFLRISNPESAPVIVQFVK